MTRTIKKELKNLSRADKRYLLDNMNYRHRLYNKGIEIIRYVKNKNPDQYISQYNIDKLLYELYEKKLDNYDYYCKGIRMIVSRNLFQMMNLSYNNGKYYNNIESRFRFKKFNNYHRSFSFNTKVYKYKDHYISSVKDINDNYIKISFGRNNIRTFYIREKSWYNKNHPYIFDIYDIKEITFKFINGKFFILLTVNNCKMKDSYNNRKIIAGIDLGERNPVVLYDGESYNKINFLRDKIKKLDIRIDNYHKILSRKTKGSNNYNKVLLRMNKLYRRQYNIRLDWRNKVAYYISNTYDTIIVDEFKVPIINKGNEDSKGKCKRNINKKMTDVGMYYFMVTLSDMCEKYDCLYIKAEPNTTRTCSVCGHINEPLPLSKKYLKCEKCGSKVHRDENAALNCYNQFKLYDILINI